METTGNGSSEGAIVSGSRRFWKVFCVLMFLALIGSLAILPFSWTLLKQAPMPGFPPHLLPLALAMTLVLELAFSAIAIALGLRLGDRVGLGAPLLGDYLEGDRDAGRRLRSSIGRAIVLGLAVGVLVMGSVLISDPLMPKSVQPLTHPPAWEGTLASVGAGIREEIWLRLGTMTLLIWLGARLTRRTPPGPAVIWTANGLAAILFAAIHLPQAALLFGLSAPLLVFILLGNGLPGLVFGWLYWRWGLLAAIAAHSTADLVLRVVLPLVPFR